MFEMIHFYDIGSLIIAVPWSVWTALSCCILLTVFQLWDVHSELWSPFMEDSIVGKWSLHHDEKLIVPDVRIFSGKGFKAGLLDYLPYPPSASFGIGGPMIASLGCRIFGLNNLGLRFFFILISGIGNVLFVLCLMRILPGISGVLVSLVYLLNYSHVVLTRHAVLENILTMMLGLCFFCYLTWPDAFIQSIHIASFIAGASIVIKINYPLFINLLIVSIAIANNLEAQRIIETGLWGACGVLFFESIHMGFLHYIGLAKYRYHNFLSAFRLLSGKKSKTISFFEFNPAGLSVFFQFAAMAGQWYRVFPERLLRLENEEKKVLSFVLLIGTLFITVNTVMSGYILSVLLFVFLYLVCSMPFFFYLKRAVSIFPFIMIILAFMIRAAITEHGFEPLFIGGAILFLAGSVSTQYRKLKNAVTVIRSRDGEQVVKQLEQDLPWGSVVYAYPYAYRFFWQVKTIRIITGDEQLFDNRMLTDLAWENMVKYVILSSMGGTLDYHQVKKLKYVKSYTAKAVEMDLDDEYALFELVRACSIHENGKDSFSWEAVMNHLASGWEFLKKTGTTLDGWPLSTSVLNGLCDVHCHLDDRANAVVLELTRFLNADTWSCPVLDPLGEDILFQVLVNDGLVTKGLELLDHHYPVIDPLSYFRMGEFCSDRNDDRAAARFINAYVEACEIKNTGTSENNLILKEMYQKASHLKSKGCLSVSKRLFELLEKKKFHLWGVYFHFGEMSLLEGDSERAEDFFRKCLTHNPYHKKAGSYLKQKKAIIKVC
ncbi:MAG: hypothetical protein WC799_19845 [Desulfobacteraceae bacterium]|jgi:hypothetical protein